MAPIRTAHILTLTALALPLFTACTPKSRYAKKAAKVTCDKLEECGALDLLYGGDYDACVSQTEDAVQESIDDCDKYSGSLAYKCLKDAEKASCDSQESSDACDEFNDKCGFSNQTAIVEYENGMSVYGLMDFRYE